MYNLFILTLQVVTVARMEHAVSTDRRKLAIAMKDMLNTKGHARVCYKAILKYRLFF